MFGLIEEQVNPLDWQHNGFTPLLGGVTAPRGDWSELLPPVEYQNKGGFDRMACVPFSLLNCLEMQHYQQTGKLANWSDRWLAKLSGTGRHGNTFTRVFDTARKQGLVSEETWPDVGTSWDDYYATIPDKEAKAGGAFLANWSLFREYVAQQDMLEALREAPLWVSVKFASGSGILNPKGSPDHAVAVFNAVENEYYEIFDHYAQTRKKYAWNYKFGAIIKPTLVSKHINYMLKIPENSLVNKATGKGINTAVFVGGKLIMDEDISKVLKTWIARTAKFENKTTITEDAWNSLEHYSIDGKKRLN